MHEYTIEMLYHFTCGKCKGWWSYAHTPTTNKIEGPKTLMFCPHCGEDGDVTIKKGFLND